MLYEKLPDQKVRCRLCAHRCSIKEGKRGICYVRENRGGTLYSLVYGRVVSMNMDPIEKKPLFHLLPGSRSLSIATVGCNFRCLHCQNSEISQFPREHNGAIMGTEITPAAIVEAAERHGCGSISYTYTEPTIYMELAYECAIMAREKGLKNVFVSNGYMTPESVELIAPYLDGNNIDLKGDEEFYRKIVCGAHVEPVKETIRLMKEKGVWTEVTTLIIPGLNDSEETVTAIAEFICAVSPDIPWHVTQYYPTYKLDDRPRTPVATLRKAYDIGKRAGLHHVYEGNIPGEGRENTYCPKCGAMIIKRLGFTIVENRLSGGACPECGTGMAGVWE